MVGCCIEDDEFTWVLAHLDEWNAVGLQDFWADHDVLVAEETRAERGVFGEEGASHGVEFVCVFGGDAVPHLGGSKVEVIDRVEVDVFFVPGEEALPHAKIRHWGCDTWDVRDVILLKKAAF